MKKDISQLNSNIRVSSTSSLVITSTFIIILLSMCVWLFTGTVTEKSFCRGIVFPSQGTLDMTLPHGGTIRSLFVQKGEHVRQGQNLALVDIGGSNSVITSNANGIVFSMCQENTIFEPYHPIISLVQSDTDARTLTGLLYVDLTNLKDIAVGQQVQIWPSNQKRDEVGYVKGYITRVTNYPVDMAEAAKKMRIKEYSKSVLPENGPAFEIEVEFEVNEENPSQMAWTFNSADHPDMSAGTICEAIIITRHQTVFEHLFMNVKSFANKTKEWVE